MKKIPYGRQNITAEDIQVVIQALQSEFLTQGPAVAEFEAAFADYIGARHAIAVSNGTAALHLAAMALDVGGQSHVITTPITFVASANAIRYCGGVVHFADIDARNYCLDVDRVEELVRSRPRGYFSGVVAVDLAGFAVDLERLRKVADAHGLWIIEDACHSPGGHFRDSQGRQARCGDGQYADIAVFSFHPVKHIACGEGGMLTTNDSALHARLMKLRTHGITKTPALFERQPAEGWYYEMQELGYNYRLTDFQAALGRSQLRRAEPMLARRREIAARYEAAFRGHSWLRGQSGVVEGHAYHLYIIEVDQRKRLYDDLVAKGIHPQVHYIPVYRQPYYVKTPPPSVALPMAERYYEHCLSLPMYPALTDLDQGFVIEAVIQSCNR